MDNVRALPIPSILVIDRYHLQHNYQLFSDLELNRTWAEHIQVSLLFSTHSQVNLT